MSYRKVKEFLDKHADVVELADEAGGRVAVCPQWQGRVMTSSFGEDGPSFGFINQKFIEAGRHDPQFNNYGGEERLWISPEGGQFSLWFKPGQEQVLSHWITPPGLNEGAWAVDVAADARTCRMTAAGMQLQNASATEFAVDVAREVRLLGRKQLAELFGPTAAGLMAGDGAKLVAFETVNTVTNRGDDWQASRGLVSVWMLSMQNAGPQTVMIVPYRPGKQDELGPVVRSDYFGRLPPQRLKILPGAVLFRADGRHRSKIGTSQRRACNVLGSIDYAGKVLTLASFSMPDDPRQHRYLNNLWGGPHEEPYAGDVLNGYNDGPNESGEQMGAFYELESLSPAPELKTGESLVHCHRTVHVQADLQVLDPLAREILGVDLETVRSEMLEQ